MRSTLPLTLASLATSIAIAILPTAALGASPAPFPDLTMAPLVTPQPIPPVVAPVVQDAGIPTDGYALGSSEATVTVEVFEDFQCPYCERWTQQIEPQLVETFVRPGIARLVFRDLPFLGEESRWASVAGRLAAQQGKFWPMHDYLFANQLGENVGSYTPDRLMAMAQAAGLDMDAFIAGLQVPAARTLFAEILSEAGQAAGALGINATPTVVVNGVPVASPDFATVSAAIQAALATSSPAASGAPPASGAPRASGGLVVAPSPAASAP